jgi:DeoR/GlpR family transcriptional regulator of sugar metabolism
MSITKRQQQLLDLIDERGYLTVEKLAELAFTSPSSIRRDLAKLQQLCLIKRTHGGASAVSGDNRATPFQSRLSQNIAGKQKIAKKAATLLSDGQTVMLDGSSTAGFLVPYIAKHKDITLFTNNMLTAINAINYGIVTHCIGGASVNSSAVLSGTQAYRTISEINTDILFFSSQSLSRDGYISDPIPEENYVRQLMLQRAKTSVFLCDSEKFGSESLYRLTSVDNIDACVFDKPFPELRAKCKIIV